MKEIETGCLAVTYNCTVPENNGLSVTVGKYIGFLPNRLHGDLWSVDVDIVTISIFSGEIIGKEGIISGSKLLRIDGESFTEDKELTEIEQ